MERSQRQKWVERVFVGVSVLLVAALGSVNFVAGLVVLVVVVAVAGLIDVERRARSRRGNSVRRS
jgi:hypothetical protein